MVGLGGRVHGIGHTVCFEEVRGGLSSAVDLGESKELIWERGWGGGGGAKEGKTHLSFTIRPEINRHPDQVIDGRVGGLIQQHGDEGAQRIHDQAGLDAAME